MKKFNIALIPSNSALQRSLVEVAQSFFVKYQDGYILGDNGLAHITLCQFHANTEADAIDVYNSFNDKTEITVTIQQFNLREGKGPHVGKYWAELLVDRADCLLERQGKCFQHLVQNGLMPLTAVETYSPHITLARLSDKSMKMPLINEIAGKIDQFYPVVGNSTDNGVLVNALE